MRKLRPKIPQLGSGRARAQALGAWIQKSRSPVGHTAHTAGEKGKLVRRILAPAEGLCLGSKSWKYT